MIESAPAVVQQFVSSGVSAIVLAQFGTGPIKGFAVTLMVGVACSIFTGVMVTRLMFDVWVLEPMAADSVIPPAGPWLVPGTVTGKPRAKIRVPESPGVDIAPTADNQI